MKLIYKTYCLVFRTRGWLRSHLTAPGWTVIGCLALLPFMRLQPEYSMGYQLFVFLLTALGLGYFRIRRIKVNASVDRTLPRFVSQNQPFRYTITISNQGTQALKGVVVRESVRRPPLDPAAFAAKLAHTPRNKSFRMEKPKPKRWLDFSTPVQVETIHPESSQSVELQITASRRGVFQFDGVELLIPDPLNLFQSCSLLPCAASLLVLPKRYRLPPIDLPGTPRYQSGGIAQSSSIGESEEFVSLRDYRRGDSPRHIHWKSLAKTGKLIVREHEDEFFVRHALVLDTFLDGDEGERFEVAVALAASFACTLDTQESLLDLMFVGTKAYCFTMGRSVGYPWQCLEILATVETSRNKPFESLTTLVEARSELLSGCILIFAEWDEKRMKWAEQLAKQGIPLLILVVVESEDPIPAPSPMLTKLNAQFVAIRCGEIENSLQALGSIGLRAESLRTE